MLDEMALRRSDFLPGVRIRLADGQEWTLPGAPSGDPGPEAGGPEPDALGADYAGIVAAILEAENEAERRRAELALGIALLARNYRLAPSDFRAVLGACSGMSAAANVGLALHAVAREHVECLRPPSVHRHPGSDSILRPRRLCGLLRSR